MARRVSLPKADDLFRDTQQVKSKGTTKVPSERSVAEHPGPSGRVRHDEKMTVYVTATELVAIEQARLDLRATHGIALDRGRLVREAISMALEELRSNGVQSALIRRLLDE